MINYYAVLGLSSGASDEDIKAAYRQNAKRYHPDLNPGNASYKQRFLEIKTAYEILGNTDARKKYDDELTAHRKVKEAQTQSVPLQNNQSSQSNQSFSAQQKTSYTPPPVQPQASAAQAPNQASTAKPAASHIMKIEELRKMHALQLELLRVSSKENMLKYRKRLQEQLEAYKKQILAEREKEKRHHKVVVDKMLEKMKQYRNEQKKQSFNAGFEKGMNAAQASAKRTIDELKTLLTHSGTAVDNKDSGSKKMQSLQMELSLINQKNRELEQQIELLERLAHSENQEIDDDSLKIQFEQAAVQIEKLETERDSLKNQIVGYETEIDFLNEELLYLEGFIEIWQDISADDTVTSDERDLVEQYEGAQRNKSKGTLYGVLGLPLNALPDEITAAFERMKKRYEGRESHQNRYLDILSAYNTLSSPTQKQAYDISINNETEI